MSRPTTTTLTLPADDPLVTSGAVTATSTAKVDYRLDGTVNSVTEPAAGGLAQETISTAYNNHSLPIGLSGASGYLLGATYTDLGQVQQLTLGTSTAGGTKKAFLTNFYEEGTGRLTGADVDDQTRGAVRDTAYTYDPAGNVTSIFDHANTGNGADFQCFTYDGQRRLTEAWTPKSADCATSGRTVANLGGAAPYWTSYTYNAAGQRDTEKQNTATPLTRTYCYDTTRTHALKATTTDGNCTDETTQYTYDATGNATARVEAAGNTTTQSLTWSAEGKLTKLTEGTSTTDYLYDADGQLLIRRASGTSGETVLYLGSTEVHLKGTKKWANRYYSAAGATIALRTNETGIEKLHFLAADHHNTGNLSVTGDTTQTLTKRYTTPFGATRGTTSGTWPDDKTFLGKPTDTGTNLTHIGAREYDPTLGQFISVDPILSLDQHQSLNGYSYANQHPSTSSDPTGLREVCGAYGNSCYPGAPQLGGAVPGDVQRPSEGGNSSGRPMGGHPGEAGGTASVDSGGQPQGHDRLECNRFGCETVWDERPRGNDGDLLAGAATGVVDALTFACGMMEVFGDIDCASDAIREEFADNGVDPSSAAFGDGTQIGSAATAVVPYLGSAGRISGAEAPVFPHIAGSSKGIVNPYHVYRGDSRLPEEVFASGFSVKNADGNLDLLQYGKYNTPSAWVGTSTRKSIGAMFPQKAKGSTWVYTIRPGAPGISMNKALGFKYVFRAEKEVVFPGGISGSQIVSAQRYSWGMPTNQIIMNPGHQP